MVKKVFLIIVIFVLLIGITICSNATDLSDVMFRALDSGGNISPKKASYNFDFVRSMDGVKPKIQYDEIKVILIENADFWVENIISFICIYVIFLFAIKNIKKKNSMLLFFSAINVGILLKVICRIIEGMFSDYLAAIILIKIAKYIIYCILTICMLIILNAQSKKSNKKITLFIIIFNVILLIISGLFCYTQNSVIANIVTTGHGEIFTEKHILKEGDTFLNHKVMGINLFNIELLDQNGSTYKFFLNKYYYSDYRDHFRCSDYISYVVFDK